MALVDCGSGVRLERSTPCRLADETILVSDHYYPEGSGPWPTLLMRQPYGRDIASTVVYAHPVWFAQHGYHVVIQDVRGRGESGGEFYPFRHEGRDGAEVIAWLRNHPACNGRIGMYGFSYQGATQLLAAAEQPEGLVCIAPHMTAADLYYGWFYHNGALRLSSTLAWGIQLLREDARRRSLRHASDRLEKAWQTIREQPYVTPYADHPVLNEDELPTYLKDWLSHRQPGPYWQQLDISTRYERITVPALHIAGWFDTYLDGSIRGFNTLCQRAGSAFARESQYLVVGPWIHIPWGDRAGDAKYGPTANLDTNELLLRWFNHWLKNSREFEEEPRVRIFSLGSNEWRSAEDWPRHRQCSLYLHSRGHANSRKGDGALSPSPPKGMQSRDTFVYDPEVPVLAPGGPHALSGAFDQSALELGNNLLVYTTELASRTMEVCGYPKVILHATTSADCADFTAKLVRVTVDERAEFLCIGIARSISLFAKYEYRANAVFAWEFELEPIAFELKPGERLRLEIASSAFPLYDRNPSSQVPPQLADQWTWRRSTQQILHTSSNPSRLTIPVRGEPAW